MLSDCYFPIRKGVISSKYKITKYILFSLSGYTDWFKNLHDKDDLLLTLDSLYDLNSIQATEQD